jgi:hypothetical protein
MLPGGHGQQRIREHDACAGLGDHPPGRHRCLHCLGTIKRLSSRGLKALTGCFGVLTDLGAEGLEA